MKKNLRILLVLLLVIFSIGFTCYSVVYKIENNTEVIMNSIVKFLSDPIVIKKDMDMKEEINIDNKKYVFYIIDNKLGYAELTRGINNKYKINYAGKSSGSLNNQVVATNKGKYLLLIGKNSATKISHIKGVLEGKEYVISIPQKEYYMVYCQVPKETESVMLDADIRIYDKNNNDISDDVFKN